ncbi:MAG: DUF1294 domain-containing protein [Firmicutes bacterium]|nr:DUF1294 domain-containing protein [Ezakiella sp.]MDD7761282.1 DUF1294 domain-containing protein [Bacillota bacterium]
MRELTYPLLIINIIAFLAFGYDKFQAKRDGWRVPEKTLLIFCLFFGAIGGFLGMKIFRHKTMTPIFLLGVPILMAVQLVILSLLFYYK